MMSTDQLLDPIPIVGVVILIIAVLRRAAVTLRQSPGSARWHLPHG
jgi:hypothetical protein